VEVDSVSARQVAVKKYVVTLSTEDREQLEVLIRTGKHSARKLLRARILLKADASEAGEAWTDSQIASGLDSSVMTVARVRQQLVEEGVDGVLTPKRSANSARQRIFDGASALNQTEDSQEDLVVRFCRYATDRQPHRFLLGSRAFGRHRRGS